MNPMQTVASYLTCAITMDLAESPVNCPCGHLFSRAAIEQWLLTNNRCPVSRSFLTVHQLTFNPTVEQLIRAIRFQPDIIIPGRAQAETSTQTDTPAPPPRTDLIHLSSSDSDDSLPPLFTPGGGVVAEQPLPRVYHQIHYEYDVVPPPLPSFVVTINSEATLDDLQPHQINTINSSRMVRLTELFNPQSGNSHLANVVVHSNREFLRHFVGDNIPTVLVRRYIYQSPADLTSTALYLASAGYFVYDLFLLNRPASSLYRYCLMTVDTRRNGAPVTLSFLRRV